MSHRPILHKQARRMRKVLTRRPLPASMDLVVWLKDHGHAQTSGEAREMLKDGCVKTRSGHTVGRQLVKTKVGETLVDQMVPAPIIPSKHRAELIVVSK